LPFLCCCFDCTLSPGSGCSDSKETSGAREYQAWIPTGYQAGAPVPLVMVIHGCLMEPSSMADQ
jgi:poly(3-hydroxybutyrate) depolymerase